MIRMSLLALLGAACLTSQARAMQAAAEVADNPTAGAITFEVAADVATEEDGEQDVDKKDEAVEQSRSIQVEIRASTESKDGDEPRIKKEGRIVIIGPDGKRQEFELKGDALSGPGQRLPKIAIDGESVRDLLEGNNGTIRRMVIIDGDDDVEHEDVVRQEPQWMVGIRCEVVPEVLNRHLKLDGRGVIVHEVMEDFPAAEKVQKDDILLAANGETIDSLEGFVAAVRASEGQPIELELLRDGEKQTIAVTPEKREAPVAVEINEEIIAGPIDPLNVFEFDPEMIRGRMLLLPEGGEEGRMIWRQFGPGLRLRGGEAQAEEMRRMIEKLLQQNQNRPFGPAANEELRKRLRELEERTRARGERRDDGDHEDDDEREHARHAEGEHEGDDGHEHADAHKHHGDDDAEHGVENTEDVQRGLERQMRELEATMRDLRRQLDRAQKRR